MARENVNTAQFNAMCQQLSMLTAVSPTKVVRSEVGKVLEKTLEYTRSASAGKIKHRYDEFVPMGIDAFSPKHTRRFGNLRGGNLIYYMGNRYPPALWSALRARRASLIKRKLAARGLAKRSWLEIANMLGITIKFPGYVASATPQTGQTYNNVSANEQTTKTGVSISIENAQPTVNAIGGGRALSRAIQGRIKYFEKNAEHAVFADVAKIAKAYPGIKVKKK
jgi:hypothetical protein